MPIYVYKNLVTNETFEHEQRITEDALTTDPRTGDPVKRLIQPVGIAFKGSGFYVTDNRGSTNGGTKVAAGSSGGEGASGSDTATPSGDQGAKAAGSSGSSPTTSTTPSTPAAG